MWSLAKLTTALLGLTATFFGPASLRHNSGLALRSVALYIKSATPSITLRSIPWPPVYALDAYNRCLRLPEEDAGELFAKVILCEMLRPYAEKNMLQIAIAHVQAKKSQAAANEPAAVEVQPVVVIVAAPKPTACFDLPGTPTTPPPFTVKMLCGRVFERVAELIQRILGLFIWLAKVASTCASNTWYVWILKAVVGIYSTNARAPSSTVAVPVLPDADIPLFIFIFLIGFVSGKMTHLREYLLLKYRRHLDEDAGATCDEGLEQDNYLDQDNNFDPDKNLEQDKNWEEDKNWEQDNNFDPDNHVDLPNSISSSHSDADTIDKIPAVMYEYMRVSKDPNTTLNDYHILFLDIIEENIRLNKDICAFEGQNKERRLLDWLNAVEYDGPLDHENWPVPCQTHPTPGTKVNEEPLHNYNPPNTTPRARVTQRRDETNTTGFGGYDRHTSYEP